MENDEWPDHFHEEHPWLDTLNRYVPILNTPDE